MSHQTALVTGGSRGIGLGCALALAKDGYSIAINGMRPESQVTDVIEQIKGAGAPHFLTKKFESHAF